MEKIHAFSIALGLASAGLTERELETRKNEARRMALAFMPSLYTHISSLVEERLVADSGSLWLAFDLVPTKQMQLALDGNRLSGNLGADTTRRLRDEFAQLRAEAGEFVVRTGRLTALASRLPQLDADERFVAVDSLSDEDRTTWEIMHRRPGRRLSVRFGHETLSTQLPMLNLYTAEPETRAISARVSVISAKSYQLNSIRDIASNCDRVGLPPSMKMDRPRQVVDSVRRNRFLLHVAEEVGIRVTLQVRVLLWQSDLSPAYLEFRCIDVSASLRRALCLLHPDSAFRNEQPDDACS